MIPTIIPQVLKPKARRNYPHDSYRITTCSFPSLDTHTHTHTPHTHTHQSLFAAVQLLSRVWLFVTPWTVACQAPLSSTISQSLLRFMRIELVMLSTNSSSAAPFSFLLSPSVFPSIRVFSNESALCIRWPKYWNFSFSISASNEYSGLISFRIDWFDLLAV